MEPNQLLLESRRKLDEGTQALEDLEHQCLRSSAVNDEILKQLHQVRAHVQQIRSSLDTLVSLSGTPGFPGGELRSLSEPIAERAHRIVERIHQIRLSVERSRTGGESFEKG